MKDVEREDTKMAGDKTEERFEINEDHLTFLEEMADAYDLPNASKALRVLLDYAMEDGDQEEIFSKIRCLRC